MVSVFTISYKDHLGDIIHSKVDMKQSHPTNIQQFVSALLYVNILKRHTLLLPERRASVETFSHDKSFSSFLTKFD